MKKLMVCALVACMGIVATASQYQVYKFQMNVKTTDAKGIVTTSCGDDYCYREKRAVTIRGILAGCGCGAINADGVCNNAILYLWDATHKIAITNVEVTVPWKIQRVGKNATVIEHMAGFKATYGADDRYAFEVTFGGFGTYKPNSKDTDLSYVSAIDGNFAGVATAPIYTLLGKCTACSSTPDADFVTTAFTACTTCEDGADLGELTPFFGAYALRFDSSMSKKIAKSGLSAKNFGLPSYVSVTDFVATNIGE